MDIVGASAKLVDDASLKKYIIVAYTRQGPLIQHLYLSDDHHKQYTSSYTIQSPELLEHFKTTIITSNTSSLSNNTTCMHLVDERHK